MNDFFYVRVVEALGNGVFRNSQDIRFSTKKSAQEAAESLQMDFDEDCEPKRAYILGPDMVPVNAAGRAKSSAMKSIRNS